MEITRQDLQDLEGRIKGHIDDKFEAHEKTEMVILDQFREELGSHHKALFGVNGTPGIHTEVDRLKGWKKWTGVGLAAGVTKWIETYFNHGH